MKQVFSPRLRRSQRGAAALEFALIFILFFALFYAIVSYSLAMLLMQGFTQAAEEGVRSGVAISRLTYTDDASYQSGVAVAARQRAATALQWLPTIAKNIVIGDDADNPSNITATATIAGGITTISVTVTYPNYNLIPKLKLPLVGDVPKLPDDLTGSASLRN